MLANERFCFPTGLAQSWHLGLPYLSTALWDIMKREKRNGCLKQILWYPPGHKHMVVQRCRLWMNSNLILFYTFIAKLYRYRLWYASGSWALLKKSNQKETPQCIHILVGKKIVLAVCIVYALIYTVYPVKYLYGLYVRLLRKRTGSILEDLHATI